VRSTLPEEVMLESALCHDGVWTEEQVLSWLAERCKAHQYQVAKVPVEELDGWSVDHRSGDIRHHSGKFFTVIGLDVEVDGPAKRRWTQPIILQPEIGVLGFVARRIQGILHVLVQAKMEPGNVNLTQISPSVQATRSNYTRVHGGRRPPLVDLFVDDGTQRYLSDQLQSEQGTRYLWKRNRNAVIELTDDEDSIVGSDFAWVTIGQLHSLTKHTNLVHLDCRSILGGLRLCSPGLPTLSDEDSFGGAILASMLCADEEAEEPFSAVLGWMTRLKFHTEMRASRIPLADVTEWARKDGVLRHRAGRYFDVVGVRVSATSREVSDWCQPLVRSVDGGVLGLVTQRRKGVLHFLVQGRAEPGLIDTFELAPTVQYSPVNYRGEGSPARPPFVDLFEGGVDTAVRVDTVLSDEGGRFYHSMQRHVVIELDPSAQLGRLPENFRWLTAAQVQRAARFSNMVNMEFRSVLACLSLGLK
jgi:dTDP-4-dehydro-6-deoxy-alpha-D-glucopyranose 2,3-dehydratase